MNVNSTTTNVKETSVHSLSMNKKTSKYIVIESLEVMVFVKFLEPYMNPLERFQKLSFEIIHGIGMCNFGVAFC